MTPSAARQRAAGAREAKDSTPGWMEEETHMEPDLVNQTW